MSKNREEQSIKQVQEILGDSGWTHDDVKQALKDHNGNVELVVSNILEGKLTPWEKVSRKKTGAEVQRLRASSKATRGRRGGANRGGKQPRAPHGQPTESTTNKAEAVPQEAKTQEQQDNTAPAPVEEKAEVSRPIAQRKAPVKPATVPPESTQTTQGFSFADAVAQNTKPKEPETKEAPVEKASEKPSTRGSGRGRGRGGRGTHAKREPRAPAPQAKAEENVETPAQEATETVTEATEPVSQPQQQAAPVQPEQPQQQQAPPQQTIPQPAPQQQIPVQIPAQQQPLTQQPTLQAQSQGQFNEGLQMPFNMNPQSTNIRFGSFQSISQPQEQQPEQWKQSQQQPFFTGDFQRQQAQRPQDKEELDKKTQEGYGARPQQPMNQGMYHYPYGNPGMNPVQGNYIPHPYYQVIMSQFPQYHQYQQQQGQKQYPGYTPSSYNKNMTQNYPQYPNQMMQPHLQQGQDSAFQYYGYQQVAQNQKEDEQNGHASVPQMNYPYGNFYYGYPPQGHHDSQK